MQCSSGGRGWNGSAGLADRPGVQMPLLELGETQALGVEPVQEVDGGEDVAVVTLVCGVGVTAAGCTVHGWVLLFEGAVCASSSTPRMSEGDRAVGRNCRGERRERAMSVKGGAVPGKAVPLRGAQPSAMRRCAEAAAAADAPCGCRQACGCSQAAACRSCSPQRGALCALRVRLRSWRAGAAALVSLRAREWRRVSQRWAARFISTTSSTVGLAGRAAKRSGRLSRMAASLTRSAAARAAGSSSRVSSVQ